MRYLFLEEPDADHMRKHIAEYAESGWRLIGPIACFASHPRKYLATMETAMTLNEQIARVKKNEVNKKHAEAKKQEADDVEPD